MSDAVFLPGILRHNDLLFMYKGMGFSKGIGIKCRGVKSLNII
jgi:hypothetical protein